MTTRRLPAYPLIAHDPTLSIWSTSDDLTETIPKHWTGAVRGSALMARVDGEAYALMGPCHSQRAIQTGREIHHTRSVYQFTCGPALLAVEFCSPLLTDDLDTLSRPLSYITISASCPDGRAHDVAVYCDIGSEWATDTGNQDVVWNRARIDGLEAMRAGSAEQRVLNRAGDDLRCDWGWIWLAVDDDGRQATWMGDDTQARAHWIETGTLPRSDDLNMPRPAFLNYPKLCASIDLGTITQSSAQASFTVAYEDVFCLEWMHRKCRPYWQRAGLSFTDMLSDSTAQRDGVRERCRQFDTELSARCREAGGQDYAELCAAAYRQAIAAHKLGVDFDGTPLFFSKENFSNGCIATVDVTYPSAPLFLILAPELLAAMVEPVLRYAASPRWRFPFAPHDLGTYPRANGQVYGGGECDERNQMPVEECGNMLILVAALARELGTERYAEWWPQLATWADYLVAEGLDPATQLCTDDFAGHLGRNANLAIKAILGVGCAARLAAELGHAERARQWRTEAERMAQAWAVLATNGSHSVLAYDHPDSWSQKYNLIWDHLLELNLFDPSLAQHEVAHYRQQQGRFGLPLDSRSSQTKLDWIVWTATLGTDDDFAALLAPVITWLEHTPDRVPMTDWYDTESGSKIGFQARSVVGGLFIKALHHSWQPATTTP
jgi:hypothetical protein